MKKGMHQDNGLKKGMHPENPLTVQTTQTQVRPLGFTCRREQNVFFARRQFPDRIG